MPKHLNPYPAAGTPAAANTWDLRNPPPKRRIPTPEEPKLPNLGASESAQKSLKIPYFEWFPQIPRLMAIYIILADSPDFRRTAKIRYGNRLILREVPPGNGRFPAISYPDNNFPHFPGSTETFIKRAEKPALMPQLFSLYARQGRTVQTGRDLRIYL